MGKTLHTGRMPGKIRIAAAADVPVGTKTIGSENLPLRDGEECFLVDSPAEFAGKRIQFPGDQYEGHGIIRRASTFKTDRAKIVEDSGGK
jgi:hypothetical protein